MHDTSIRTANLLGAAALTVTDLALAGATDVAGVGPSSAAALVVLSGSPRLGVTELGRRVGLSQPATARMVDSLEARGLVIRCPGAGRVVHVELTAGGRQAVHDLLTARGGALTEVLGALDDEEQQTLAALLAKLLTRLYAEVENADLLCRLCDRDGCTRDAVCPVGEAERRQAG